MDNDITNEEGSLENINIYDELIVLEKFNDNIIQSLPDQFSLESAYPNPFNPTTTLSFSLPLESEVNITVYNLQGREVITLLDGNINAGYHSITWHADNNSSGVYFVKMVADKYVGIQKLMLVK